jgi:hypothetical protein
MKFAASCFRAVGRFVRAVANAVSYPFFWVANKLEWSVEDEDDQEDSDEPP